MTEVAWMLAGAFLCVWIVAFVGVLRVNRRSPGFSSDAPPVSVVVAARNEAPNVPRLVEALKRQEYPDDKLEIIFVDDRSEDETAAIYERETRGDRRFRLLRAVDKRLPAKKGALQLGVEAASHDLILITDGDAAPSAGWARAMAGELDAGADVAFCAVANFRASGLPNAFARYERFRVSFLTFAAAGWGAPYSAVGSGFGYRRAAYETIGGYEAIAETLSGDDDLFLREAARRGLRATATGGPIHTRSCARKLRQRGATTSGKKRDTLPRRRTTSSDIRLYSAYGISLTWRRTFRRARRFGIRYSRRRWASRFSRTYRRRRR